MVACFAFGFVLGGFGFAYIVSLFVIWLWFGDLVFIGVV